ncbi:MAG: FecR family protein [Paludibacteraceae bacterium]
MDSINKDLIKRVISGNATRKEARDVVDWFSSTTEGQAYLSELISNDVFRLDIEGLDGLNEDTLSPILSHRILAKIDKQIQIKTVRRLIFRVAAVLIPFIFLVSITLFTNSRVDLFGTSQFSEIYIPKGEKTRIMFQDGSEAFLNSDTRIRFPQKFGLTERKIQIEGEAYFHIISNKNRPFIVQINDTKVKVFGTEFNVKAYKNDQTVSVVLDKGKIAFITPMSSYTLIPGQQALYDKETGLCSISYLEKSSEASLWVNNILQFKDTPLAEVLKTLNRRFNVEFSIKDPDIYKYTYTLTIESSSLEKIMKDLEKITPVRFNLKSDNVVEVITN